MGMKVGIKSFGPTEKQWTQHTLFYFHKEYGLTSSSSAGPHYACHLLKQYVC